MVEVKKKRGFSYVVKCDECGKEFVGVTEKQALQFLKAHLRLAHAIIVKKE